MYVRTCRHTQVQRVYGKITKAMYHGQLRICMYFYVKQSFNYVRTFTLEVPPIIFPLLLTSIANKGPGGLGLEWPGPGGAGTVGMEGQCPGITL